MSNIFDALNKDQGEMAELILPLVGGQNPSPAVPAPPPPVESVPQRTETPLPAELHQAHIRTLPLRIASPSPLLPFDDGHWQSSEQYRILRTKIGQHPKQPRLIVISSPAAGDGKSVTAINTAGALSLKSEAKVLLLDADFRRSSVHRQLGLPAAPGLSEVLKGACTIEQALVQAEDLPNLYIMTAGAPPANPVELLDSPQWPALCASLRSLFRYVILDSTPVAAVADYDLIQAACDGVILVIRPDHTNRSLFRKALETLPKGKLIGVLLNCIPEWFLGKYTSPDYYYYAGPESSQSKQR